MKRRFIVSFILLSVLISQLASASLYMFPMSHPVYDEMDALYTLEGVAAPLGTRPWSETDVQHMLDNIEISSKKGKELEERIASYIRHSGKAFNPYFTGYLNPALFTHSNSTVFNTSDDAFNNKDLLNHSLVMVGLGMTYKNYLAAELNLNIGFNYSDSVIYGTKDAEVRYKDAFSTNIFGLSSGSISQNFPDRAYIAAGNDFFRLNVGRDRLFWGNGLMGNVILGDTLPYHDALTLTFTGSKYFTYQFLISFFTHPDNLPTEPDVTHDRGAMKGTRFLLGHRFEMRFFKDKVKLVLNEAIMYSSADGYIDPRIFNPVMILHSLYIANYSNSIASFELEYSPVRNLGLYISWAIDDLALGEAKAPEKNASPDGWALQGGARYTVPLEKGYLFGNTEVVYTTPYAYHRGKSATEADRSSYFVSTIRNVNSSVTSITRYLSFPFGSDTIAVQTRFGYDSMSFYRVQGVLSFMVQGVIDKYSKVTWYDGTGQKVWTTPSQSNPFDNPVLKEIEYTLAAGAEADFDFTSYFSVGTSIYLVTCWNKNNEKSGAQFDIQFALSAKLYL